MWNDRIVVEKHEYTIGTSPTTYTAYTASLYEFYYDDYGKYMGMNKNPTVVGCDGETEEEALNYLKSSLMMMLDTFTRVETGVNGIVRFDDPSTFDDIRNPPKPLDADDAYMDEKYGDE